MLTSKLIHIRNNKKEALTVVVMVSRRDEVTLLSAGDTHTQPRCETPASEETKERKELLISWLLVAIGNRLPCLFV